MPRRIAPTSEARGAIAISVTGVTLVWLGPMIAGVAGVMFFGSSFLSYLFVSGVCMIPVIAGSVWLFRIRRRTLRQLEQHNYLLCTECRYPLEEMPGAEALRCPECGVRRSSAGEVQESWRSWRGV